MGVLANNKKCFEESRQHLPDELQGIDVGNLNGKTIKEESSLLKLPTELTFMIFEFSFLSAPASSRLPQFGVKSLLPEIVLSHVCKRWRELALGYSNLWTKFFFHSVTANLLSNSIHRFEMYIKRSNPKNLELFLDFRGRPSAMRSQMHDKEYFALVDMAVNLVERWKIVTLLSDRELKIEKRFLPTFNITSSAPNLEYFAYSPMCTDLIDLPFDENPIVPNLNPIMFQGGAPKLHYLLLDGSSFKIPPLSNLTTLRIEPGTGMPDLLFDWDAFLGILLIPSLTNLSIVGGLFTVPIPHIPTITMPKLERLRYNENIFMMVVLPFLRAPLLETLWIQGGSVTYEDIDDDHLPVGVANTASYFFPSLQTLILVDASPPSPDLADRMMQMTRNITSLFISSDDEEDNFLGGLQEHGSFGKDCWPKLTTLTTNFPDWDEIGLVVDFVRSRASVQGTVLKLRVFYEPYDDWRVHFAEDCKEIKKHCTLEFIEANGRADKALQRSLWPPETECPDYSYREDPFEFFD